jgi:lipopolysaccharide/colanic/teichoic acid biosynthesis glycosyltransferase
VFLKLKRGSGVVLRLLFAKRRRRGGGTATAKPPAQPPSALAVTPCPIRLLPKPQETPPEGPGPYDVCKRCADFVAALILLVLTAPLLLLSMLLVKLSSRGPVLYTQTRVGRNGLPFTIYKLRSMVHKCESLTGARWAVPGDPRVTRVGRFLRRTHLDELPQLWNVLRGDMSLVGPRPERPEFVPRLEQAIPCYRDRLQVRPGVTGLAQVQLPPDTDFDSVRLKLAYDLYYVRNCGLWLDARIMLSTACKMVGLPFRMLRQLFRFPRRDTVEAAYTDLSGETPILAPRVQTA